MRPNATTFAEAIRMLEAGDLGRLKVLLHFWKRNLEEAGEVDYGHVSEAKPPCASQAESTPPQGHKRK